MNRPLLSCIFYLNKVDFLKRSVGEKQSDTGRSIIFDETPTHILIIAN
jgi:hypothetical protein